MKKSVPSVETLVASDLDRTLVYSAAALRLGADDARAPRLLCVEVYEGKPLSYVTETAAALLDGLARTGAFVPATTRTRAQYGRIRLPGPVPRFAVCANGGEILVDGEPDTGWRERVRRAVAAECATLDEVRARLVATADPAWLLRERTAEDLFAYLVVDRERLPVAWVKELTEWAGERGWNVSLQGRKIYAVPRPVTKSAAVAEVARRTGATCVLSAGDSLLDADLLLTADRGWRPGHGELAETGWGAPHVVALETAGVAAGEEIARAFAEAVGVRISAG
ncbi:HAD family hydrolase [Streptomyces sp. CA-181903]|uniref:HAD family hydrolase n=1 Tax=Streptomyces sp. CA-181903 TaxID=3240055 RepID=UPI003D8E6D82